MIRKLIFVCVLTSIVCGCTSQPMTLDRLVAANTNARGGAAAIESIQAVGFEFQVTEPKFTVRGRYVATREGFMRVDIMAGGERVYTEALGPDGAWQLRKGQTEGTPESEAGAAALRRGVVENLYGLHELPGLGYTLTFAGSRKLGNENYWAIDVKAPSGFSETLYLDEHTYLVTRKIETSALHPDLDAAKKRFETLSLDYRPAGGVEFARKSEKRNLDTGEIVQTTIVKSVSINPDIDGSVFRRPQSTTKAD